MLFDLRAAAEQQLGQVRRHTHDWQGSYPPSSFEQGGALLNNSAAEACKRPRFYFIIVVHSKQSFIRPHFV